MNGVIIFFIFVFIVIPVIKNIAKAKPATKFGETPRKSGNQGSAAQANKNWAEVQKVLQQKINSTTQKPVFGQKGNTHNTPPSRARDSHGHSGAREQTRQQLRARKGNPDVFPEDHQVRVKKRDQRDRSERNRIEAMLHSRNNRSIIQDGNNSIDGWGERGDNSGGNGFLFLVIFGLIALLVLFRLEPELWVDVLEKLNIR